MSKIFRKYEFEDVTEAFQKSSSYGWINLLPTIEYRHKYWYMSEFTFIFWKWEKRIEITRTDWNRNE